MASRARSANARAANSLTETSVPHRCSRTSPTDSPINDRTMQHIEDPASSVEPETFEGVSLKSEDTPTVNLPVESD